MASYITTYAKWAADMYASLNTTYVSSLSLTSSDSTRRPWLPEGLCVITQLALLNLYPYGRPSFLGAKGTKIGFERHTLTLYPPNALQFIARKLWPSGRTDLAKLPKGIMVGVLMKAPDPIDKKINLSSRHIPDLLNDRAYQFSHVTRIYLYAINAIKRLAVTYDIDDFKLGEPVDEVKDLTEVKYLKQSFEILSNALKGNSPKDSELHEIGQRASQKWDEKTFEDISNYLKSGSQEGLSPEEIRIYQDLIAKRVRLQEMEYIRLCEEHCSAIRKTEEVKEIDRMLPEEEESESDTPPPPATPPSMASKTPGAAANSTAAASRTGSASAKSLSMTPATASSSAAPASRSTNAAPAAPPPSASSSKKASKR